MRKCSEKSIGLLQLSCYHLSGPTKVNNFNRIIRFCDYNSWRLKYNFEYNIFNYEYSFFKHQYYKNKGITTHLSSFCFLWLIQTNEKSLIHRAYTLYIVYFTVSSKLVLISRLISMKTNNLKIKISTLKAFKRKLIK